MIVEENEIGDRKGDGREAILYPEPGSLEEQER